MLKQSVAVFLTVAVMSAGAYAQTISEFRYDNGKKAEIYIGNANVVYLRTEVSTYDTKFEKGNSSDCPFKKYGSCKSKSEMISEIQSKTYSGEYWR